MNCQQISLDDQAKIFIKENLRDGLTLAQCVIQSTDITNGTVVTYVPHSVNASTIINRTSEEFRYGQRMESDTSLECLVQIIQKIVSSDNNWVCVFENASADRHSDQSTPGLPQFATFGNEVYHLLSAKASNATSLKTAINAADSLWILIGVLARVTDATTLAAKSELAITDLDEIAQGAEHIIVMAFDDEGYLLWSKRQQTH